MTGYGEVNGRQAGAFAALSAVLCLFAAPAFAVDGALLKRAGQLVRICFDTMPDTRAARTAMQAAGLKNEGSDGGYYLYSSDGFRVVAAVAATSNPDKSCMVSVHNMSVAEAKAVIAPFVKQGGAKALKTPSRGISAFWVGRFKRDVLGMAVISKVDFGQVRGAAIAAVDVR